jgi:hypothetical protein
MLTMLVVGSALLAQTPSTGGQRPTGQGSSGGQSGLQPVAYDKNGWPIVPSSVGQRPAFLNPPRQVVEPAPRAVEPAAGQPPAPLGEGAASAAAGPATAAAAGAFRALGGRSLRWALTVHGPQGETVGTRELTHLVDCSAPTRDRLEFDDGRVYGRDGVTVFAARQGLPWPTLVESATVELELFALHARLPWLFADGREYVVLRRDRQTRQGRSVLAIELERVPETERDRIGPVAEGTVRDRFELIYDATTGEPVEVVHCYANGKQTRRARLEDWREVEGVRMPFRRVYVDGSGKPTTTLELRTVLPAVVGERTFRL